MSQETTQQASQEAQTPQDLIAIAIRNCEELIHSLRLSYDISAQKRVSDIIVAQELSLMELKSLL